MFAYIFIIQQIVHYILYWWYSECYWNESKFLVVLIYVSYKHVTTQSIYTYISVIISHNKWLFYV